MKRTELQQAIEEIITEILSESDVTDINNAIKNKKIDPKKVEDAAKQAQQGKSDNLALMMATAGTLKEEEDDDDSPAEKEPTKAELKKLEKELGSKNKKKDEIISAYKKIAGDIKEKAKAANSGDKEAKAWIDKHQSIIKAYKKLQKVG